MTFPEGWATVVVNGDFTAAGPSGTVASGRVEFDTIPARLPSAQYGVIAVGTITGTLVAGVMSAEIAAVDSLTDVEFLWQVTEILDGLPVVSYVISPTAASSPVNLATAVYDGELPASYTVVTGPQGLPGPKGDKGQDGGGGNYDPEGSADDALAAANTYTDEQLAAEVERADGAYDHTGAASTAAGSALISAKAYADTGDGTTLAAAKAYTDEHSGGGSGSAITTRSVRITDDNLSGLPSASGWAVVLTSAGTPLQCSIPAAVNDRIESCPNFMHVGGHFLDWAILTSAGAIDRYASTESTTPGSEGAPEEYPALTFEYAPSTEQFTVQPGNVSGGSVTVALVHQGTGTGNTNIVYAHATYPWRLRLKNLGPEPS